MQEIWSDWKKGIKTINHKSQDMNAPSSPNIENTGEKSVNNRDPTIPENSPTSVATKDSNIRKRSQHNRSSSLPTQDAQCLSTDSIEARLTRTQRRLRTFRVSLLSLLVEDVPMLVCNIYLLDTREFSATFALSIAASLFTIGMQIRGLEIYISLRSELFQLEAEKYATLFQRKLAENASADPNSIPESDQVDGLSHRRRNNRVVPTTLKTDHENKSIASKEENALIADTGNGIQAEKAQDQLNAQQVDGASLSRSPQAQMQSCQENLASTQETTALSELRSSPLPNVPQALSVPKSTEKQLPPLRISPRPQNLEK